MSNLRNQYYKITGKSEFFLGNLTDSGGSGVAKVDGSVTPVEFFITPPPSLLFEIEALMIVISDTGNAEIDGFGNIAGPLANGCLLSLTQNSNVVAEFSIDTNRDLDVIAKERRATAFIGNSRLVTYTFTLESNLDPGFRLDGLKGDKISWTVRDNLLGLEEHSINFRGSILQRA